MTELRYAHDDGIETAQPDRATPRPSMRKPFTLERLPTEGWTPLGRGQGPFRKMVSFASRRTELLRYSVDGGAERALTTDHDMFHGNVETLEAFGIGRNETIEQTDLPLAFAIRSPDGAVRTITLAWDGSADDMMSFPPHVVKVGPVAHAVLIGGATLTAWGALFAIAKAAHIL